MPNEQPKQVKDEYRMRLNGGKIVLERKDENDQWKVVSSISCLDIMKSLND